MPIQVKQRGFTLIELMVIIALVAIMAGIAVPSFTRFVNNNRVTTQADEIHRFLQYARGEAVVRRQEQEIEIIKCSEFESSEYCDDDDIDEDKERMRFVIKQADRVLDVDKALEFRIKVKAEHELPLEFS